MTVKTQIQESIRSNKRLLERNDIGLSDYIREINVSEEKRENSDTGAKIHSRIKDLMK